MRGITRIRVCGLGSHLAGPYAGNGLIIIGPSAGLKVATIAWPVK
jgi:hypothetical protein